MSGSFRDVVSAAEVVKTLRKHLSTNGVHRFANVVRSHENKSYESIEDGDIVLSVGNRA